MEFSLQYSFSDNTFHLHVKPIKQPMTPLVIFSLWLRGFKSLSFALEVLRGRLTRFLGLRMVSALCRLDSATLYRRLYSQPSWQFWFFFANKSWLLFLLISFLKPWRDYSVRGKSNVWRLAKYWLPTPPTARRVCPPSAFGAGGGHTRWMERGVGGSIFWKTPGTALYSTYVSTFCSRLSMITKVDWFFYWYLSFAEWQYM